MRNVSDSQPADEAEPVANRAIDDVESLRAMADSTRLAILNALMAPQDGELPVMSAKDLASQLGESQTKLYRHIRQLEAAGLIRVAATRMVSGIQEQRYQASQRDVSFRDGFLREHADESEAMIHAMISAFRDGYFSAFRDVKRSPEAVPADQAFRRPKLFAGRATVSPAKAAEIRNRLDEFLDWLAENLTEERHGIQVSLLAGYYSDPAED
jgi:DNA-binding transcriptional ArsR family regulator